jgi:hypothetical protein
MGERHTPKHKCRIVKLKAAAGNVFVLEDEADGTRYFLKIENEFEQSVLLLNIECLNPDEEQPPTPKLALEVPKL